ncbi:cobalt-precorrin 5A hydrolase [uncultured Methanoregula sp.]|uniref:cobalt-precorrin 5A hydrolase n=1 Tax=uncultured Methanoregula sp. TaxID=1005933 RepID=UPI002AAB0D38|nr:cobalt-precorrin 5A hydrolase [uncultured Methanoregula sp.]
MTETVVVALKRFLPDAERIAAFLHADVIEYTPSVFPDLFPTARRIVAIMSMGIAVRGIAPLLHDKWTDPAVVVVSPDFRFAIPLIGGHHGANELAKELAGLGLVPVITTATEATGRDSVEGIARRSGCDIINKDSTRAVNAAMLDADVPVHAVKGPGIVIAGPDVSILVMKGEYTVGVGCRKGITAEEVTGAIRTALAESGISQEDVLVYATTAKKLHEAGLAAGVGALSGNLIFLDDDTINAITGTSPSRAGKIGLLGVAEPAALAVSRKKELVMGKKIYGRVTVAIAH